MDSLLSPKVYLVTRILSIALSAISTNHGIRFWQIILVPTTHFLSSSLRKPKADTLFNLRLILVKLKLQHYQL